MEKEEKHCENKALRTLHFTLEPFSDFTEKNLKTPIHLGNLVLGINNYLTTINHRKCLSPKRFSDF